MREAIYKALMQLFALIVDVDEVQDVSDKEKEIIRSFLSRQLNSELASEYMELFEEYMKLYHGGNQERKGRKKRKRTSLTAMRILGICEQINEELTDRQKIFVIQKLVEYIAYGEEVLETEVDFLETVATAFNLDEEEFSDIFRFTIHDENEIPREDRLLVVDAAKDSGTIASHHLRRKQLSGTVFILHIASINAYFLRYRGNDSLVLNGQPLQEELNYTFDHGSSLRGPRIDTLYYTDVAGIFTGSKETASLSFYAEAVEFRFPKSENGIQDFNLNESSGRMIGIMGGSGVGKSTLLNVLNGNLEPRSGRILINGIDLYKDGGKLSGVIGFVPQDDLLLEELTVRQNLYYNALLCLDQHSEEEIERIVDQVLHDLDLYEIRDLKVGKPLNKVISGGQRKRVNIGLELIREPAVLFVDEPTSGLSSLDSEMVMNLLHEQAFKGRLVFVNIHQPSSNLYKMFNKIIFMDKGGYQIFYGHPSEAVIYFKTLSQHANPSEDQCPECGNIDPDQVLQIIEAKIVNEYGKLSRNRKVSPVEWAAKFKENRKGQKEKVPKAQELPENNFSIPGRLRQLKIYFERDFRSRITNMQYVLITLLEAPLLALIMAFFTKYFSGEAGNPGSYLLYNNENLAAYLLMSVVVFLFLGLTLSAEEIIRDRKIMQRESFLKLSRGSYLHSKVLIMFSISAFQSLSYVLVGNLIFEIHGMLLPYWLILFTTSCFANMMGLNISAGLNSVITIYILVPFLLIPQILFAGVLVKYEKLHKSMASEQHVPFIGNVMASRWAYEALTVEQFSKNRFARNFFHLDQEFTNADYLLQYLIPELEIRIDAIEKDRTGRPVPADLDEKTGVVLLEVERILESTGTEEAVPERWDDSSATAVLGLLSDARAHFEPRRKQARMEKQLLKEALTKELGGVGPFTAFRNAYENNYLNKMLADTRLLQDKMIESEGRLIRKYQTIYMKPESRIGRAHLYAPVKRLGSLEVPTLWFNTLMIWLMSALLYLTLYYDLLRLALGGGRKNLT